MKDRILSLLGQPTPTPLKRINTSFEAQVAYNGDRIIDLRTVTDDRSLKDGMLQIQNITRTLQKNQQLLLVGSNPEDCSGSQAIFQRSLVGITKSLAKEIGHRAQTVNLIKIPKSADLGELAFLTSFLTTGRSAFITGQVLSISNGPVQGSLRDKVCLVTGGAGGIGSATVKRLESEGAKIILIDVQAMLDKVGNPASQNVKAFAADLTNEQDISSLLDLVRAEYGHVDVLINNAGITRDRTLGKMSEAQWDQVLNINLMAVLNLTDRLLEANLISENGTIINTSSISGIAGNFGQTNYTATKAALIEMGAIYSEKLSEKGITVNAIAPGYIETQMVKTMPFVTRFMAERLTCLLQAGAPEDIAEAMAFLAHPGSRGIKGEVLRVCGGSFLGA